MLVKFLSSTSHKAKVLMLENHFLILILMELNHHQVKQKPNHQNKKPQKNNNQNQQNNNKNQNQHKLNNQNLNKLKNLKLKMFQKSKLDHLLKENKSENQCQDFDKE
jgi:hypothetical protein